MTTSIGRRSDGSLVLLDTQEVQLCSVEFLAKIVAMHNEKLGDLKRERALANQLAWALEDIADAGIDAWGANRPCVNLANESITAWKEARK